MSYSSELKNSLQERLKKKCCKRAFSYGYAFAGKENTENEINFSEFGCGACKSAFLAGVFSRSGTVSDPAKSYHIELNLKNDEKADLINEYISQFGVCMKKTQRGGFTSLYLKKSDDIQDFLHSMGAAKEAFDIANDEIKKEFSNNANRSRNCEMFNITKTVKAAGKVIDTISRLVKNGRIKELPDNLCETAMLRYENPEASIAELAELHKTPISKSGVSHRLEKIMELTKNM